MHTHTKRGDTMTVGERIRHQRENIGMSQEELAKKLGYKDRSSVSKIEKESDMNITLEMVQKFADVLRCSPAYLMGWLDDSNNSEYSNIFPQTEREKTFVEQYSQLDANQQKLVDNLIETFLSKK